MVQTISQSKTKNAKVPDVCSSTRPSGKTRKEAKPIIIDDTPTTTDLDTKTGLDTQSQGATMTKTPNDLIRPGTRGALYLDPIARSPPKPPELQTKEQIQDKI